MGSSSSKEIRDAVEVIEEENKQTPITPSYRVMRCDDPRSPTAELSRTPIEIFSKSTPVGLPFRKWYSDEDLTPLKRQKYPTNLHLIDDPRSPTLGITRTPIQISSSLQTDFNTKLCLAENYVDKILDQPEISILDNSVLQVSTDSDHSIATSSSVSSDPSENILLDTSDDPVSSAPYTVLFKTLSKIRVSSGSYVYEDDAGSAKEVLRGKEEIRSTDWNSSSEKENDNQKRKLSFTPEAKTGFKVRTPLGSRSNFQDSPSLVLKMKQVQKLDQEMENDVENRLVNSFGSNENSLKLKKQHNVDWDNKDSTLIM